MSGETSSPYHLWPFARRFSDLKTRCALSTDVGSLAETRSLNSFAATAFLCCRSIRSCSRRYRCSSSRSSRCLSSSLFRSFFSSVSRKNMNHIASASSPQTTSFVRSLSMSPLTFHDHVGPAYLVWKARSRSSNETLTWRHAVYPYRFTTLSER